MLEFIFLDIKHKELLDHKTGMGNYKPLGIAELQLTLSFKLAILARTNENSWQKVFGGGDTFSTLV